MEFLDSAQQIRRIKMTPQWLLKLDSYTNWTFGRPHMKDLCIVCGKERFDIRSMSGMCPDCLEKVRGTQDNIVLFTPPKHRVQPLVERRESPRIKPSNMTAALEKK
jgi:hypothetical protein